MVIADHREKVDALAAEIRKQGVAVSSEVVIGTPFIEVIRRVLRDKHDLVIVAAEGRGGLKERLFRQHFHAFDAQMPLPGLGR